MVRPPGQTAHLDAASPNQNARLSGGLGLPQGFSLGSALNRQLLLGWARRGTDPIFTPPALQDPQPSASALLAAASSFLGPKSILQRVKRSQARSRLPPDPHTPPLWTKKRLRPRSGDDFVPLRLCNPSGIL